MTDPPVKLWRGSSARVLCSSKRRDERGLLDVVHWLGGAGSEVTLILRPGKPNRGTEITLLPFKDSFTTLMFLVLLWTPTAAGLILNILVF